MKSEVELFDKKWELIEHFKYTDKMKFYPIYSKYLRDRGASVKTFDGKPFIMINNRKHISLLYTRGGGLYREVKE